MSRSVRASLVVWIDERRVGAAAVVPGDRPRIVGVADLPVPGELLGWMESVEKAGALGQSLRAAMKHARLSSGARGGVGSSALGVVSRQCIVLKRLRFEAAVDPERDLPGMVRLQFVRQLALPLEGAAIDYALHDAAHEGPVPGVGVVAAAMIGQRVQGVRAMVRAAGLRLTHLGVSPSGLAALAGPALAGTDGPVLAVVPTNTGAEYLIVDRGRLSFARAVELTLPDGGAGAGAAVSGGAGSGGVDGGVGGGIGLAGGIAHGGGLAIELLATEAKRTWVSERLSASGEPVSAAMALVPAWVSESDRARLAERCAAELGIRCSSAALSDLVGIDDGACGDGVGAGGPERVPSWLFAAAGVAQGRYLGLESIDLLRERKPPDAHAKWRKLAMAGALALVAGLGTGYTVLSAQLRDLRSQRDTLAGLLKPELERIGPAMRTQVQLAHLSRWDSARIDWLGHVDAITASLPGREAMVLSDLSLSGEAAVAYEPARGKRGSYDPAVWAVGVGLEGTLMGRASSTRVVDVWRGRLVGDALYTVSPVGRDMPGSGDQRYPVPVALRLATRVGSPVVGGGGEALGGGATGLGLVASGLGGSDGEGGVRR